MTSDQLTALGAFLSGVGSILSAAWWAKRQRRRLEELCDQRLAEYDRALHEGIDIGKDR